MKGSIPSPVLWISASVFALVSAAAGLRLFHGVDLWLLRTAQTRPYGFLDTVGEFFSTLGGVKFTFAALIISLTAIFFSGRRHLAGRILVAFLVTSVVEIAMKLWLPQVPLQDAFSRSEGHIPTVGLEYSYPSGHMLRTTILLGTIFILWKNRIGRCLLSTVFIGMALSRVYMGVHWASDVIGGTLLGIVGLAWVFRYRKGG